MLVAFASPMTFSTTPSTNTSPKIIGTPLAVTWPSFGLLIPEIVFPRRIGFRLFHHSGRIPLGLRQNGPFGRPELSLSNMPRSVQRGPASTRTEGKNAL